MASKIRVSIGNLEIEIEGEESFVKEQFPKLLTEISKHGIPRPSRADNNSDTADAATSGDEEGAQLAVGVIAQKLGCKSGSDLAFAAAVSLAQQKDKFTREEILSRMKAATHSYKGSYRNNLTSALKTLVTGQDAKLLNQGGDVYSLSSTGKAKFKEVCGA